MSRTRRILIAGLVTVAVAACNAATTPASGSAEPSTDITVYVRNNYATSMDAYAVTPTTVARLGVVGPGTTRSFVLPPALGSMGGTVAFRAQPTGYGPIVDTEALVLHAGQVVDFEITTNLIGSHANIRM